MNDADDSNSVSVRDLYILGLLSLGRTYGHEVIKAIQISHAERWVSLSNKHVYYVLRKLARNGWVREFEERRGSTPPRKVYEITATGREELRRMLLSPLVRETFNPEPFDTVIGTLAYTDVLSPAESLSVLRARSEVLQRRLTDEFSESLGPNIEKRYGFLARSIYEKARILLCTEIEWLQEIIERVEHEDWQQLRAPAAFWTYEDSE